MIDESVKGPKTLRIRLGRRAATVSILKGSSPAVVGTAEVTELPEDIQSLVFFQPSAGISPMMIAQDLKLRPLVYARNITVDTGWPNNVRRNGVENAWDSGNPSEPMGLAMTDLVNPIKFLVKPVQGQSEMVLAVPPGKLAPGVYRLSGGTLSKAFLFAAEPLAEAEKLKCADVSYKYFMGMSKGKTRPCSSIVSGGGSGGPVAGRAVGPVEANCEDYDSCITGGVDAYKSREWNQSLAFFQKASDLNPSKSRAWAWRGAVYLVTGRYADVPAMWDKALQLGSTLTLGVCRERFLGCDAGVFFLNAKEVSFVGPRKRKVFAVAPSEIVSLVAERNTTFPNEPFVRFRLRVSGKKYNFDYMPYGVGGCQSSGFYFACPEPGLSQQQVVAEYAVRTIPKLAQGGFTLPEHRPVPPAEAHGGSQAGGASAQSNTGRAQTFGPEAIWNLPQEKEWEVRNNMRENCFKYQGAKFVECVISMMRELGASPPAIAFTRLMDGRGFMASFDQKGPVDLVTVFYPFRANDNSGYVLVNGNPQLVRPEDHVAKLDIRNDPLYTSLARRFPKVMLWPGNYGGGTMERLPTGRQRFIFGFPLLNGCHACEVAGSAEVAFDFDSTGKFLGTKLLRLHKPEEPVRR